MKKMISLILAAALLLTLSACGAAPDAPAGQTHIVVDHNGNEVELPMEIERIAVCGILPLPSVLAFFFDSDE